MSIILERTAFTLLLVSLVSLSLAVPTKLVPYEREFYEVSESVRTPHIPWAKPYGGKRVRALLIAPWFCHRHTVEMAQRLDFDYQVVMTTTRTRFGLRESEVRSWAWVKGLFYEEREAELQHHLENVYDVIVVGSEWRQLPLRARYEILRKVQEGTGLLIGYAQSGPYLDRAMALGTDDNSTGILAGVPTAGIANLEKFASNTCPFRVSSLGRGRILMFRYRIGGRNREYMTPSENTPAERLEYDVYQSLAIRALLWCARAEAPVAITKVEPARGEKNTPPDALNLSLTSSRAVWSSRVEVVWCDKDGRQLASSGLTQRIESGKSTMKVPIPELPAGTAYACVRVLRDEASVGWGCFPVVVETPVAIAEITFAKELYGTFDPVSPKIQLNAPAPADCVLTVDVQDALGRLVQHLELPVQAGARDIAPTLVLPPPACVWHGLEAELLVGGRAVSIQSAEFFREWRLPYDEFQLVAWYGPSREAYMDRLINQAFARSGIDTVYPSHVWGEGVDKRCVESIRAGMSILPYVCHLGENRNASKKPHVRNPSVNDPEFRKRLGKQVVDCARQFRRFCPVGYSLGDENYFGGSAGNELCTAPDSIAYFRNWLRSRYGTLDAVNSAWRSVHSSFDEIKPTLLSDAQKSGNPAPWIDFRLAMEQSWSDVFAFLSGEIGVVDPKARVGHEGSGRVDSFGAFDWWTMLRRLDMFVPYPGRPVGGNLVRSLRQPGTMSSYWYGSYTFSCGGRRLTTQRYFPWYCLFQGFNSAWYFNTMGNGGMAHEVGFAPDLRPLPHFAETAANCREIKQGLDRLLLGASRDSDGIAIYYSTTSIHENTFYRRSVTVEKSMDAWCRLLNDLGFQYDFISYEQVAQGLLSKGKYRLLILPMTLSMSASEARGVKRFAEAGGAILADFPPAVEDEHGRPWPVQPLAGLLGEQPSGTSLTIKRSGPSGFSANLEVGNSRFGILRPARKDEMLVLRHPSKPVTLLNAAFPTYSAKRATPAGDALRELLAREIKMLAVRPFANVRSPAGSRVPGLQTFHFVAGDLSYLCLMQGDFTATDEHEETACVQLPERRHVYDVREGRYLGFTSRVDVQLETCRGLVLALLPYVVARVDGLCATVVSRPYGRAVTVAGELQTIDGKSVPKNHIVRVEVHAADGTILPAMVCKVAVSKGLFSAELPLSLDAVSGKLVVVAIDVSTGVTAVVPLSLGKEEVQ